MNSPRPHGNTLTEYGLIAASIAIVSIGCLHLFGNSIFKLYTGLSTTVDHPGAINLLSPMPGSNGGAEQAADTFSGFLDENGFFGSARLNRSADSLLQEDSPPTAALNQAGTGNPANATSVDGNAAKITIRQNIVLMQKLQDLLDESNNATLQAWGQGLIKRMVWLTASEGYAADIGDFKSLVPEQSYSNSMAVNDILIYQGEIDQVLQGTAPSNWAAPKPANVDPGTLQKIEAIVNQVTTNAKTMAVQMATPDSTPTPTLWTGQYNVVVNNNDIIQSTIQSALQNGDLNVNKTVLDTAQKTNQTQDLLQP
jgi:Flp pilus assembly pilin Flp